LVAQFTLPGLLAVGIGIVGYWQQSKLMNWGLGWIFVAYSIFYMTYSSNDAVVYLISAWVAVAAWIGMGVAAVWGKKFRGVSWGTLISLVLMAVLGSQISQTWAEVNPQKDTITADYLEIVTRQAPVNAFVLTMADADTFPLWYEVFGQGLRRDLKVVVLPLTQFEWYQDTLRHTYPHLMYPQAMAEAEWGEEFVSLNPELAVCRSELVGGNLDKIKMTCNGNEILNLDFSEKGN
jgi:hypothetical protein